MSRISSIKPAMHWRPRSGGISFTSFPSSNGNDSCTGAMKSIYVDHKPTTPIDPDVLKGMLPFPRADFGNPSAAHALGRRGRPAAGRPRADVAALIGARADEIVFTSGGTEASNMAIRGAMNARADRHAVITTAIEHPATEECCRALATESHPVHRVAPMRDGCLDPDSVKIGRAHV